jgi:hypothetical protein
MIDMFYAKLFSSKAHVLMALEEYHAMPTPVTSELWYVAVSEAGCNAPDADVERVLQCAGCCSIESLGSGTAQCRIPTEWLAQIERQGGYTHRLQISGRRYRVDVDLP